VRFSHESPGLGAGAQVPHEALGGTAQNPVSHWAGNVHALPFAISPVGWEQAAGELTLLK